MFVKAIEKASKAMFPIVRFTQVSKNQAQVSVVGTGFFVDKDGTFISVAHVFDVQNKDTKYQFIGYVPSSVHPKPLEIEEIKKDDDNDLFIGKVDLKTPDYLELSQELAPIGKSVCIAGYPLATFRNNGINLDVSGVRRYFQPSFVLDHWASMSTTPGNSKQRKHVGFIVRDVGLFGMSGGPIFDTDGLVLGVQASVTEPRKSTNGQREISVEHALAIKSPLLLGLLNSRK